MHTLAYILDSRYVDRVDQAAAGEMSAAFGLLKSLAAARDVKHVMNVHGLDNEADLLATYERAASAAIMAEYTAFRSKAVGVMVLEEAWEENTIASPRQWWLLWGSAVPHLQAVAVNYHKHAGRVCGREAVLL